MYGRRSYRSSRRSFSGSRRYTRGSRRQTLRQQPSSFTYSNVPPSYRRFQHPLRNQLVSAYRDRSTLEAARAALEAATERSRAWTNSDGKGSDRSGHGTQRSSNNTGESKGPLPSSEPHHDDTQESKLDLPLRCAERPVAVSLHWGEHAACGQMGDTPSDDRSLSGHGGRDERSLPPS